MRPDIFYNKKVLIYFPGYIAVAFDFKGFVFESGYIMKSDGVSELKKQADQNREPDYEINDLFAQRWSPRALGRDMSEDELKALFEAARWAPSSYNNQSWRFLYATFEDEEFEDFRGLMNHFNDEWASEGYALVLIVSKKTFDHNGEESVTHSFDTGAAWQNFALEAADRGLVAHGMQGFNYEKAHEVMEVPDGYQVEAMVAVGSMADESSLPEDMRVEPNGRKPQEKTVTKGKFDFQ